MEAGWVYVLVNPSYLGIVKVGRTSRETEGRAAELSAVTGVPTPFIVAFEQYFDDCHHAEQVIHGELDRRGWRVNPNREFFRASPSEIVRVVLDAWAALGGGAASPSVSGAEAWGRGAAADAAALLAAGDRALFGQGDAMQDTGEAARFYKLAAARGSAEACERLGGIYLPLYVARPDRAGRRRALGPLKEGARRGNAYCFVGMSELFALEGHRENFAKAWQLFFSQVRLEGAGVADLVRFAEACGRYIGLSLDLLVEPGHLAVLRSASDAILSCLLAELDRHRADETRRGRAARKLRWVYEVLLAQPSALAVMQTARRPRRRWVRQGGVAAA
jgi:hypothetical protein